jgi:hypothetical protein
MKAAILHSGFASELFSTCFLFYFIELNLASNESELSLINFAFFVNAAIRKNRQDNINRVRGVESKYV